MVRIEKLAALAAIVLLGLGTGCQSISDSVTSPSRWLADSSQASADSSNAASDSSSGSSSPDGDEQEPAAYRHDVRVATRSLAGSGADDASLMRELGRIAERHGIARWEARPGTWSALGAGFGEAGRSQADVEALVARIGGDASAQAHAARGYASAL
jgi:hypothetical protein